MKIFLSHTGYDAPVVQFLRDVLGEAFGIDFFLLPDDAPPGSPWIERIKLGVDRSDELYSIVTPESLTRPWISAEWACFWMQEKPTTPLLVEVSVGDLWEPMRAFQSVDLLDISSTVRFLRSLADRSGREPTSGVTPLAHQIVKEVPRIRDRQALGDLERAINKLHLSLQSNQTNVDSRDVRTLIAHDRMDDLISMATSHHASQVKRRQVAVQLVEVGRFGDAVRIGEHLQNRAEVRTICVHIVRVIPRGATESSDEWKALDRLHANLGTPQRRDVLQEMEQQGIAPLGVWAS